MEDDNGLELSLGLSFGGSAGKLKEKEGSSSDAKSDEGSNSSKVMGDLKNFLNTGVPKQDMDDGSQRHDHCHAALQTPQENFFTNLTKSAPMADASKDIHGSAGPPFTTMYGGLWDANNKSAEVADVKSSHNDMGKWLDAGNKRKLVLEERNHEKKHERELKLTEPLGMCPSEAITSVKASHVSVTTEDGSTAENEDVAESEVEGSTSRLLLHHEDATKHFVGSNGASSEITKESHVQRQSNVPPRNEAKLGNLTFGTSLPLRSETYSFSSKFPNINSNGESNTSGFPLPCVMQLMPPKNNEGSASQTMNPGNLPLAFGYSPLQIPTLDTDRSWGSISHPQHLTPSFGGRSIGSVVPNSDRSEDALQISRGVGQVPHRSSEALPDERKTSELTKGVGKQHATEEGGASSSQIEGNRPKEAYHNQTFEGYPREVSVIRPGVAPGLKFGGSGCYPDLPWVSTTAPGPNGRTISGVPYRVDQSEIKIVCACHGSHMSPEEFVQHASADQQNPENNTGLASFPSGNPATSARN